MFPSAKGHRIPISGFRNEKHRYYLTTTGSYYISDEVNARNTDDNISAGRILCKVVTIAHT
jgi:hypothetical protein